MKTHERYVKEFHKHDWKKALENSEEDFRRYVIHAAKKDSDSYKKFNDLFKKKYGTRINYPTYCRLVATAVVMGY
ncbi:hypothetical protein [Senegalia massiliensis]|uniref:Uncharacterized protein n=1 Tax=Senegalia massiliensis TaxID=1720316 RepID=A0A845R1B1_9CLOT|nr:hypothetical protein [Senegalia massiliensis]NBI07288.1 hypothetical protein [Senegalia massiliensis]